MKYLKAPWRWSFVTRGEKREGCLFCQAPKKTDEDGLVCWRGKDFYIMLNKYPYTSGHLMIAPYRHMNQPGDLPPADTVELWGALQAALAVLDESFHPQGYNIGMNIGEAAGAGIKDHFHLHVVPRWKGDANFLSIIGDIRLVSYDLAEIFHKIKDGLARRSSAV